MGELAAFLGIAILVFVTPGQDTALTIRNTLLGKRRGGVATAAGVAAGQACWTAAASVGLAALLAVARAGDLLRRQRVRRTLDALTGTLLVAFGIRLAAD